MYKYIKRIIDIIVSTSLLILTIIPMIIIAILIKLESDGPVIFKQVRTGKNGKNFMLYKFRSMEKDNDVLNFKTENKITKVGNFIRKTSLDELPQLINVLKGEMSIIGPRPWIVEYYEKFTDYQKRRVDVLPGITGLAQASGRNNLTILEKINYDIEYVNNLSLFMDIKVLLLTIKTIFNKASADLSKSGISDELEALTENYLYVTKPLPNLSNVYYRSNGKSTFIFNK